MDKKINFLIVYFLFILRLFFYFYFYLFYNKSIELRNKNIFNNIYFNFILYFYRSNFFIYYIICF